MFSENQKISERQMARLLIFDMCGISTLLLPGLLGKMLGTDGIFAILLGAVPVYFFTFLPELLQKNRNTGNVSNTSNISNTSNSRNISNTSNTSNISNIGKSYPDILKKQGNGFIRILMLAVYAVEGILLAGYGLFLLSDLMVSELLKDSSFVLAAALLLLLCGYGIWQGIEGRARVYEILFWFAFLPLILMLLLATKDVNTIYWTPVMVHSWEKFLKGTAAVVLLYGTMAFVLFLQPYLAENVRIGRTCRKSLCVTVIFNAAIYLITLGIFGSGMLPKMKYPAITLMSMIKLPGGFFERQDAFMVAIWFFTIYAFINTGMFYASDLLKAVWQKERQQKADGKNEAIQVKADAKSVEKWAIPLVMVLTFTVTLFFYRLPEWKTMFIWIQAIAFLPLTVILPLCIGEISKCRERDSGKK